MRSINSILIALLAVCMVGLSSCNKDDDEGPSKPAFAGVFKAKTINPSTGEEIEWVATSTSAVHDTIVGSVLITAKNAAGDVISIYLPDTTETFHSLFQMTTAESTYQSGSQIATTRSNDVLGGETPPAQSIIQTTDNGATDGILKGEIHTLNWYIVGEGPADDVRLAFVFGGEFEVKLTRKGLSTSGSLSANVNGAAFNATNVTVMGPQLIAMNDEMHSISITVPSLGITEGTHEIGMGSPYQINYSTGTNAIMLDGTITITSYDGVTPKGTFEASGESMTNPGVTVEITNGSFSY